MKVLLVGGGGREHALAWRLRAEDAANEVFAAPGNPGIAELATCVPIAASDFSGLMAFARREAVDFTLIGPEAPLAAGIVDAFAAERLPIFGPTRGAAMLESSKAFSKEIMLRSGVPTARAFTCRTIGEARRAIDELGAGGAPVVVKASGLAAGKGVIVCASAEEARDAAAGMLDGRTFGDAGATVLIEEFMEGEELSVFVITDGTHTVTLPAAQDHKRLLEGDRGPNTGGMGAYCPVSVVDDQPTLLSDVIDRIVGPTLETMRDEGTPFRGLLYTGLMLTAAGPRVIEFNCRFGDPETQAVLPAIGAGVRIGELMNRVARGGSLADLGGSMGNNGRMIETSRAAVTTVLAASGYPESPRIGDAISIPASDHGSDHRSDHRSDALIFHAGTKLDSDGRLITAGGRVLAVTGLGATLDEAQQQSLAAAASIDFAGKQFRSDIAWRELERGAGAP